MTQNNTMTLEDAKKLLDEYKRIGLSGYVERFYEGDPIGARPHFLVSENKVIPYIDRLIEAARIVQRAEDEIKYQSNYEELKWYRANCLLRQSSPPKPPLSDNPLK